MDDRVVIGVASAAATILGLIVVFLVRRRARPRFGSAGKDVVRWPDVLGEALRLVLEGDAPEATARLKAAVERGTDNPSLFLALGALLREQGEPERAAALHRGLTVRRGIRPSVKAEAYRQVALDLLAAGRSVEASEAAQKAAALVPQDPVLLALDRDAAYEAGDVDRSLACHYKLIKATGRADSHIEACLLAARADRTLREGDESGARRDIKRARKTDTTCARARFLEARLEADSGRHDRAAEALGELQAARPGLDSLLLPHLATMLHAAGDMAGLEAVRDGAREVTDEPRFRCGRCALESAAVQWRCPSCGAWESWAA